MSLFAKSDTGLKEHIDTCAERYANLEAKIHQLEDKIMELSGLFDRNFTIIRRIYSMTIAMVLLIVFVVLGILIWIL